MNLRIVPGLVLALAVAACGGAAQPSPSPSAPQPGPVETVERDGLRMTLAVELAELPIGGRTWVTVTVENRGAGVALWQGGGCEVPASVTIDVAAPVRPNPGREWAGLPAQFKDLLWTPGGESSQGYFQDERFLAAGGLMACPANLAINELDPGERVEHRAAWDGDIGGAAPPAGLARIKASFPYVGPKLPGADPFAAPLQPLEVDAAVAVVDRGLGLISPGQAIDVALTEDRFVRWISALPMDQWQGVELRFGATEYVVIQSLLVNGVLMDARVTVDRHSGNLLSYVEVPRPIQ